ncbi:uncharacterized protein HKW66_Vig0024290 [Vigna angularis]|uniref:SET domain-containing protein n=1 Tax=Phaseolus angularis TaxID=3914 RepID=A0A8T0L631_PHAAN|nr:uncharacterized protein HKW66_Vig0024290 [Vigna angularis]
MDTDEECSIVLELPERDPFSDKKKKLLQSKGFGPKERIYLRSSSKPDWMSATVEVLLQIARIIQLNELELYFAEEDVCTSMEFYSPRNELEALNSIVLLTDISLSSCSHLHTNILQGLRQTILDLITDVGDKNSVKGGVVQKDHSWTKSLPEKKGQHHNLHLMKYLLYGGSSGATELHDQYFGDKPVYTPEKLVVVVAVEQRKGKYGVLKEIDGISSETILLLWSMKDKYNSDSKFKIYFDTLPEKFNTGLSFSIEAITVLDGTLLLEEIMQARQFLHAQYDELFPALCNTFPDIFPPELYTWEKFLWACELWYSNSMKIMYSDGKIKTCLIPIAGFLNHSLCPHVMHYGQVDPAKNSLKFCLSRPCKSGEECCLSYGNFSSSHLITFYGFLPQGDNPYDVIPLDIDGADVDSGDDIPKSNWTSHMLQENLENELEVLENLKDIFDDMIENMGEIDLNDRENCCWDEKLAMDFKSTQRRIACSVSTSCLAGMDMLKNELCKCMAEDILG